MARKLSKEVYDYVIATVRANGHMPTEDIVELIRGHYDHDPEAARERELRRYAGRIFRSQRDVNGVRTMFLEKKNAMVVDVERCDDLALVRAVAEQLRAQVIGITNSYNKAAKRMKTLDGQTTMFDAPGSVTQLYETRRQAWTRK